METGYGGSKLKRKLLDYNAFSEAIQKEELVFLFGTGISSALTGKPYSWGKWISDGLDGLTFCSNHTYDTAYFAS